MSLIKWSEHFYFSKWLANFSGTINWLDLSPRWLVVLSLLLYVIMLYQSISSFCILVYWYNYLIPHCRVIESLNIFFSCLALLITSCVVPFPAFVWLVRCVYFSICTLVLRVWLHRIKLIGIVLNLQINRDITNLFLILNHSKPSAENIFSLQKSLILFLGSSLRFFAYRFYIILGNQFLGI